MSEWGPSYEEVEDVRPFIEVAEDRGYTIGENAEDMAVAQYSGQDVFLEAQGSEEASYNIMADILGDQLSEYGIRTPSASYEESAVLQEMDSEEGVLISEELGNGIPMSEESHPADFYAESLINTFAFEALMGQGDIPQNTDVDSEGFYAFDFGNSGASMRGIYNAVKGEAQKVAEELGLDDEIQDYDRIGETAVEMAEGLDMAELEEMASAEGVDEHVYEDIRRNIRVAREASESDEDLSNYFWPQSPEQDKGVELM